MNTAERIAELERQNEVLREALQEVTPRWRMLKDGAPPKGGRVWCLREWVPGHIDSDGTPRREVRMALRKSDAPPTYNDDPSRDCWWYDDDGASWADTTVLAWCEIAPPSCSPTAAPTAAYQHSSSRIGGDKGPCNCGADRTAAVDVVNQGPKAYCKACHDVGMSNCGNFDECDGATCITCHRPLNSPAATDAGGQS